MLARIRPDGLVCRLLRQEKHNTSLVNVRCRRGCVFFSLPLPLLPMATALRWDHCCSTSNDGDCCWTTTRRCFGGDGDTCRRDTRQGRAGRGGGGDASSWTRARRPPGCHTARVRPRPFAGPLAMPRMRRQGRRVAVSVARGRPGGSPPFCLGRTNPHADAPSLQRTSASSSPDQFVLRLIISTRDIE